MTTLLLALCSNAPLSDQVRHPIYYDDKNRKINFSESTAFVVILPVDDFKTGDGYWRCNNEAIAMKKSDALTAKGQPHQIIDKNGMNYYLGHAFDGRRCLRQIDSKELVYEYAN